MSMGTYRVLLMAKGSKRRPSPVGAALKRVREQAKLSQRALAEAAGVHYVTVAMLESGARQDADLETLRKLAKALGVRVSELSDSGLLTTAEDILREYAASPYAAIDKPTAEEMEWLRSLPGIVWKGFDPTPKAVHHLLEARRSGER